MQLIYLTTGSDIINAADDFFAFKGVLAFAFVILFMRLRLGGKVAININCHYTV